MHRYALLLALFNAVLAMPADHDVMRSQPSNMVVPAVKARLTLPKSRIAYGCPDNNRKSNVTEAEKEDFLKTHNSYRAKENASLPNMVWDEYLSIHAQMLVDVQTSCTMQNKIGSMCRRKWIGQNEGMDSSSADQTTYMPADKVLKKWYQEKSNYNLSTKRCNTRGACRHYTQMVWRGSTKLGCAVRKCGKERLVVCDYLPTGNWYTYGPHDYGNAW